MARKPERQIEPLSKGLAPWTGGKRSLAPLIVQRIGRIEHRVYAEPFVGMGGVFLRRPQRARREAINDRHREVATLFRVLQTHPRAFVEELEFSLHSRAEMERLCRLDAEQLTDIQRAARLYFIQRANYGGKPLDRSFVAERTSPGRAELMRRYMRRVAERLAGVEVECLDFQAFIERYDSAATLFYVDPPYWGTEHYYGRELFSRSDFTRLAEVLQGIKGRFLLSLNDVPEVRKMFRWARLRKVTARHGISGGKEVPELLIEGPVKRPSKRGENAQA